jgi:copper transport protein
VVIRRALIAAALAGVLAGWLALGLGAVVPAQAQAHATLERTTPARGAALAQAPAQVSFGFDESVDAQLGAVKVFDAHGRPVQQGAAFHPGGDGAVVAVRLPSSLPPGDYTATYRVISDDSHPVSGGFTFTVGSGGGAGAGAGAGAAGAAGPSVEHLLHDQTAGPVTATAFSIVRALQYAAIALGLGGVIFLLVSWFPALAEVSGGGASWSAASAAFAARLRLLLLTAAGVGAVSAVLAIGLEAATGEGESLWSAARASVVGDVLATRFGVVWGLALLVWLAVGATVLARRAPVPSMRPAAVGAAGLALPDARRSLVALAIPLGALTLLPALTGHGSVQSPVALLLPANVLHVLAMAAWLGGIAVLVLALRCATSHLDLPDRTPLLVAVVGRFSRLAGLAFAVLLASGVIQGIVEVASVPALFDTAFGRAVLIKLVLFGALVGFGWVNRSRILPQLRAAGGSPARAGLLLRRTLRAELGLGVAALAVTGALAGYPPSTAVSSGPVSRDADVGAAHLEATVDPARSGANSVHLYLFDHHTGAQFTRAKQVTLTASLPAKGIAPIPLDTHHAGPGHYVAAGTLAVPGDWRLAVTVRTSAFDEAVARLTVPIR